MNLSRLTWAQADTHKLATARGFAAFGIPAGTIRRWAHEHRIAAHAKAPGGAHLYAIQEVSAVAETMKPDATTKGACK